MENRYNLKEIAEITGYHHSTLSNRFKKEGIPKTKEGRKVYFMYADLPSDIKDSIALKYQTTYVIKGSPVEDNFNAAGVAAHSDDIEGIGFYTRPTIELTAELIDRFISLFGKGCTQNILIIDYSLHPYGTASAAPDDPGESDGD